MAEIEEPVTEEPKRGRGRPKGSLNKKTIASRVDAAAAEMREKLTLDVSFEEAPEPEAEPEPEPEPELAEPEPEPEPEPEEELAEPEPEPPPSPKKRAPRAKRQPKE